MKRRTFLRAGVAAVGATTAASLSVSGQFVDVSKPPILELTAYSPLPGKQEILDEYLQRTVLPFIRQVNGLGGGPSGVFMEADAKGGPKTFVLAQHHNADYLIGVRNELNSGRQLDRDSGAYLAAKPADKVHGRIESSILVPITGMPKLEKADTSKPRIFNLRTYRSHNARAAAKKVEMFNKHELAIFRRVGLTPVFFASAIVGPDLPNLTYMLVFPDDDARKAAWARFGKDPEWQKLKAMPEYADKEIISEGITNRILTPASYSEI
jgi:hypothetical protein